MIFTNALKLSGDFLPMDDFFILFPIRLWRGKSTFSNEFLAKFSPVCVPETSQSNNKPKSYGILQVARGSLNFCNFFQIIFSFPHWHILSWVLVLQPPPLCTVYTDIYVQTWGKCFWDERRIVWTRGWWDRFWRPGSSTQGSHPLN